MFIVYISTVVTEKHAHSPVTEFSKEAFNGILIKTVQVHLIRFDPSFYGST